MLPLQTVFHRLSCIFPAEVDAGLARPTIVARKMPRCGETGVPPTSAEPYILGETGEQIAALLNANNERYALLKHTRDAC